uniref:Truncated ribosomal protein L16 n=1 Tax=Welwitschia mirabilis TaxID=3377 RepID=D2DXE8_WELMI|nr:truncated ribosomal protein L16 [Welwitschia mirabilis]
MEKHQHPLLYTAVRE